MAGHVVVALLMQSVFLGVIFAKLSHPERRSRTVLVSDSAVIARRDGALKFCFRVADIQARAARAARSFCVFV